MKNINRNGDRFRRFLEDIRVLYPFNAASCFHQPLISINPALVPSIDLGSETEIDSDNDWFAVFPDSAQ